MDTQDAQSPEENSREIAPKERLPNPVSDDIKNLPRRSGEAVDRAVKRYGSRRERLGAKIEPRRDGKLSLKPDFGGRESYHFRQVDAFGTTSPEFAAQSVGWLAAVVRRPGESLPTDQELNAALAAVSGIEPETEVESMLAMQMYGAHEAAMNMLERANRADSFEALQTYASITTKMMRTYVAQTEALAKLRRRGEQTVRVEHVHVYPGGQAIVGAVTHPGGGGGTQQKIGQPHATDDPAAFVVADGASMLCDDPEREAVPVASGEGKSPV